MENQKLIDMFDRSSMETIRIHVSKWRSVDYIDVRIWIRSDPLDSSAGTPTKKGIRISADLLPKLILALEKARAALDPEKGNALRSS